LKEDDHLGDQTRPTTTGIIYPYTGKGHIRGGVPSVMENKRGGRKGRGTLHPKGIRRGFTRIENSNNCNVSLSKSRQERKNKKGWKKFLQGGSIKDVGVS